MPMYMYICIYTHTHTHIYIYICTHIYIYIYICTAPYARGPAALAPPRPALSAPPRPQTRASPGHCRAHRDPLRRRSARSDPAPRRGGQARRDVGVRAAEKLRHASAAAGNGHPLLAARRRSDRRGVGGPQRGRGRCGGVAVVCRRGGRRVGRLGPARRLGQQHGCGDPRRRRVPPACALAVGLHVRVNVLFTARFLSHACVLLFAG